MQHLGPLLQLAVKVEFYFISLLQPNDKMKLTFQKMATPEQCDDVVFANFAYI